MYKFGESHLEPHLNSCVNMQASHNEGVTQTLSDVQSTLAEVTVIQSEEKDGRLNERCVDFYTSILNLIICVYLWGDCIPYVYLCSNEKKFVVSGLEVAMYPTWHERQSAYVAAVKAFVIKLGIEADSVEIKFVRSFRTKPKLFLDVECGNVSQ